MDLYIDLFGLFALLDHEWIFATAIDVVPVLLTAVHP